MLQVCVHEKSPRINYISKLIHIFKKIRLKGCRFWLSLLMLNYSTRSLGPHLPYSQNAIRGIRCTSLIAWIRSKDRQPLCKPEIEHQEENGSMKQRGKVCDTAAESVKLRVRAKQWNQTSLGDKLCTICFWMQARIILSVTLLLLNHCNGICITDPSETLDGKEILFAWWDSFPPLQWDTEMPPFPSQSSKEWLFQCISKGPLSTRKSILSSLLFVCPKIAPEFKNATYVVAL